MNTLLLEKDQKKPSAYSEEGAFFVISKINLQGDDRLNSAQRQFIDIASRQLFHEFEKLNLPTKGNTSAAGSTGVSPAKARV